MPTFKIDDCIGNHPKILDALDADPTAGALGLFMLAGAYCSRYLTDGRITLGQVRRLGVDDWRRRASILVDAGLWIEDDGGFRFPGWEEWNETKVEVEERRRIDRERKRAARKTRKTSERSRGGIREESERTPSNEQKSEQSREASERSPEGSPGIVPDRIGSVKLGSRDQGSQDLSSGKLAGMFGARYEVARGLAWYYGPHGQALEDIRAQLLRQTGDPIQNADRLLDAFFADEYAASADFSPRLLASQFGRHFKPPPKRPTRDREKAAEEAASRRVAAEREHSDRLARKLAEDASKAHVPSDDEIRELTAGFGRQLRGES